MGYWRDQARPIIASVIKEVGTEDRLLLKRRLREAYPFGPREHFPYKVWCDEIHKQLGLKKDPHQKSIEDPNQLKLF